MGRKRIQKPLTEDEKSRWLEIRFHFLCKNIANINHQIEDVYINLTPILTTVGLDVQLGEELMGKMFEPKYEPYLIELLTLSYKHGVYYKEICKKLHISYKYFYNQLDKQEAGKGYYIYPRCTKEETKLLEKFFQTYDAIHSLFIKEVE